MLSKFKEGDFVKGKAHTSIKHLHGFVVKESIFPGTYVVNWTASEFLAKVPAAFLELDEIAGNKANIKKLLKVGKIFPETSKKAKKGAIR